MRLRRKEDESSTHHEAPFLVATIWPQDRQGNLLRRARPDRKADGRVKPRSSPSVMPFSTRRFLLFSCVLRLPSAPTKNAGLLRATRRAGSVDLGVMTQRRDGGRARDPELLESLIGPLVTKLVNVRESFSTSEHAPRIHDDRLETERRCHRRQSPSDMNAAHDDQTRRRSSTSMKTVSLANGQTLRSSGFESALSDLPKARHEARPRPAR